MAIGKAPGSDGWLSHGGFLFDTGERNKKLIGANQWVTYDNLLAEVTIVAAAFGIWLDLAGSSKWTAVPNPKGGSDAKYAAELVQEGVLDARMETRWRAVVKRQVVKKGRGFALHAKGWRRDSSGRIVLAELAHRAQWSIERWLKPAEGDPWTSVVQRTRSGAEFPIDRRDLFYSREGALGDSPLGVGLFRHLVAVADTYTRYRQIQGIGFDVDVNGIPLGRAPLSELIDEASRDPAIAALPEAEQAAEIQRWVMTRCASIRDLIENRVVTPNRSLLLDSLPYFSTETDGSSRPAPGTFKWSVETLRQQIGSIPELGTAIGELNWAMAIVLSCEWMLMGAKGSSGAYAASADKTGLFTLRVDGSLDDIGDDAERDVVPDILERNGITDERLLPSLQHSSVGRRAALAAAEMLAKLASAKLKPGDPAENVLRAREELPPIEYDDEDIAAWRAARGGGGSETEPGEADADEEAAGANRGSEGGPA